MLLSIVVPVYNEEESLEILLKEIFAVAKEKQYDIEVIFVDDGSTDSSWSVVEKLGAADNRVRGIRFRRNFGKAAGLQAGFSEAKGEIILSMDADLQDDPKEIPNFLEKLDMGYDCVSGWKKVRHDPWHKVYPSRVFNWMVSRLTGVVLHDHNCGMKAYRREIFDEIVLYGEMHRFVPVLAGSRGFKVGEIVIQHRAREFGHSKYGVSRIFKGFMDLMTVKFVTSYGQRPLHLLGNFGMGLFSLGALGIFVMAALWVLTRCWSDAAAILGGPFSVSAHPALALFSVVFILLGAQFLCAGLLAELITSFHQKPGKNYSVKKKI